MTSRRPLTMPQKNHKHLQMSRRSEDSGRWEEWSTAEQHSGVIYSFFSVVLNRSFVHQ
jgi:hypothetical protein